MASIDQYRFTLRIHPLIMEKMKYIAETNGRSVNKEIEQILKWVISDYENKRGRNGSSVITKTNGGASILKKRISPASGMPVPIKKNPVVRGNRTTCAASPSVQLFLNLNETAPSFRLLINSIH